MKPLNMKNPIKIESMKPGDYALHGDVIIERIESLPSDFEGMEKSKDDCLAYGEHTGHFHKLFRIPDVEGSELPSFDLRISEDGVKFLKVTEPVALRHQEHREITLPPGEYKIGIQREYDPFTKIARSVVD